MSERRHLPVSVALGSVGLTAPDWLVLAGTLAELPIERVWVWDHLLGRGDPATPVLEALTLAAAALATYPTLNVGTLVLDVTKRHPALVAKSVATIASIAPGRFMLGLGAGGDAAEHAALKIPFGPVDARIAILADTVAACRSMLEGDASPRPNPPVPILVAGDHPASIALAARSADAWVAPVATFDAGVAAVRERAAQAQRRTPHCYVLQELKRSESLAASPFGLDPAGYLANLRERGADAAIVTLRSRADLTDFAALMEHLR